MFFLQQTGKPTEKVTKGPRLEVIVENGLLTFIHWGTGGEEVARFTANHLSELTFIEAAASLAKEML